MSDLDEALDTIKALGEREARLRGALKFYADPENYDSYGAVGELVTEPGHPDSYDGFSHDEWEHDNGERARAALQGEADGV